KTFDGQVLKMWYDEGILFGEYKVETVDLESAKLATKERVDFTAGRQIVVLVDYTTVRKTTKEARDYLGIGESSDNIDAMAILIASPVGSMMTNFYLTINKPPFPLKVFSD